MLSKTNTNASPVHLDAKIVQEAYQHNALFVFTRIFFITVTNVLSLALTAFIIQAMCVLPVTLYAPLVLEQTRLHVLLATLGLIIIKSHVTTPVQQKLIKILEIALIVMSLAKNVLGVRTILVPNVRTQDFCINFNVFLIALTTITQVILIIKKFLNNINKKFLKKKILHFKLVKCVILNVLFASVIRIVLVLNAMTHMF